MKTAFAKKKCRDSKPPTSPVLIGLNCMDLPNLLALISFNTIVNHALFIIAFANSFTLGESRNGRLPSTAPTSWATVVAIPCLGDLRKHIA